MVQLLIADLLHERLHLGITEFGLGLTLELRLSDLHRDHRGQTLTDVIAGEVRILVLEELLVLGVLVHHGGQRGAETLFVGAAFVGVDGVGERVHRL